MDNQTEVNQAFFDKAYEKVKHNPIYAKGKEFFENKLLKEAKEFAKKERKRISKLNNGLMPEKRKH